MICWCCRSIFYLSSFTTGIFSHQNIFQVTKVCYVPDDFTRKMPKYERFIRPMAMRFKKAHVTHPELKATFCLPIIGVKKNPSSPMFTSLGVITKV